MLTPIVCRNSTRLGRAIALERLAEATRDLEYRCRHHRLFGHDEQDGACSVLATLAYFRLFSLIRDMVAPLTMRRSLARLGGDPSIQIRYLDPIRGWRRRWPDLLEGD